MLSYLEHHRPKKGSSEEPVEQEPLFLSEMSQPLTKNAITQVFDRLSKRARITDKPVSPSVLRDTFAVRSLQAGGALEALRDHLGLRDVAALKRYRRLSERKSQHGPPKAPEEVPLPRPQPARPTRRRGRRKPSSATSRTHRQSGADKPARSLGKVPIHDGEEDP